MKKVIGIITCCMLSSCGPLYINQPSAGQTPGVNCPHQLRSPLPWVSILPSKDALAMKVIDVNIIINNIHFDLDFHKFRPKIAKTRLILLDYKIQPPKQPLQKNQTIKFEDITYFKKFKNNYPDYVLKMSIYTENNRPPAKPDFEETIKLGTNKAAPLEAILLLSHEILMDFATSDIKKIDVDLD